MAEATHRLLGGLFALRDLGASALKGFAVPVRAFAVAGEAAAEGRFEALHASGLTPLVGREHELALLLDRWERAKEGDGQVVLLAGEAGIGKSRLVRTMRERLAGGHTALSQFCSPHHTHTALHPVIGLLEREAGLRREEPPERQREKLAAALARAAIPDVVEGAVLLADLLGIPARDGEAALELSPQQKKERTFRALLDQLAGLAARGPVLALFEDVHWADPTTLELIGRVVERAQRLPVLAVITFRPEFVPPWAGHGHVTALSLSRLARRQSGAMVEQVTGGKALPAEVVEQILARTDGVPLFVEELTKAVLESGLLRDAGDRYELLGPLAAAGDPCDAAGFAHGPARPPDAGQGGSAGRGGDRTRVRPRPPPGGRRGAGRRPEGRARSAGGDGAGLPARRGVLRRDVRVQARPGAGCRLPEPAEEPPAGAARAHRGGAGGALPRGGRRSAGAAGLPPRGGRSGRARDRLPAAGVAPSARALGRRRGHQAPAGRAGPARPRD